ncbi:hypothetical protein [Roseimicrobium sp. ORNL1]|uniref:hypothetical protein n=1 Tax=Roseimicrobium sp. ORNL1 TaxID=2711231 RepID=UPI0013E1E213|nr:hypothetical protein [Roseimicrobium sp. ORNL1]QIF04641.1 hypothetical protein G5S37_24965 [Roseimicrobium sp. ORNL1]
MKKTPMVPAATVLLPQEGFLLRVTETGWINIVQGDEESGDLSEVAIVILSPREAKVLLDSLPEYIRVAGELHQDSEVPCV